MTTPTTNLAHAGSGPEVALIGLGAAAMGVGFASYLGASLAVAISGVEDSAVGGGLGEWLTATWRITAGETPSLAWRDAATGVPDGAAYWLPAGLLYLLFFVFIGGVVWLALRLRRPKTRVRFGQPTDAREATTKDVVPLRIDSLVPPTGRMLLGRLAGHPKVLLATEDRERHPLTGKAAVRQGNRGSVAMIGPTGSGKTANIIAAIATWDGPVVNVSVKRDLFDTTSAARSAVGEVAVFDPGAATGLPTARWSPIANITTSSGALRTGRALAQAIPRSGVTSADYWAQHGEKLLGAFMGVAGLARVITDDGDQHDVGMEQVSSWVTMMAGHEDPMINDLLTRGLQDDQPIEVQLIARHATRSFVGLSKEDHKIRSSIYATAALAVDPWLEPSVAHSATTSARRFYDQESTWSHEPRQIDLEWLTSDNNTLYITASQPEFERLSPVLGGLLADIKDTLHAWDIAGRKLDKPLLIVIDEAGQLQLGWLPAEVSTIAALGAFFVTAWQSLAQVQHRYGTQADAVLSGHRSKCFFAGIDDLATINYLKGLLGTEHVQRISQSSDIPSVLGTSQSRRSVSESTQQEEFAPANATRQMVPAEAVLLHGTLPPIHLEAVRWWLEPELAELVRSDAGKVVVTCPLSEVAAGNAHPAVDSATVRAALTALNGEDSTAGKRAKRASGEQACRNVNARCDRCNLQLGKTNGVNITSRGRSFAICQPPCG